MHFTSSDTLGSPDIGRSLAVGRCHALPVAGNLALSTSRLRLFPDLCTDLWTWFVYPASLIAFADTLPGLVYLGGDPIQISRTRPPAPAKVSEVLHQLIDLIHTRNQYH